MIIFLLVFIFGAMVGSFLNVCIARLPNDESIVHPRSRCPQCKKAIAAYDNIPILSYLILRGRCRGCSMGISLRYPLVEFLMGVLAAALFWRFGLGLAFVSYFIFSAALVVISFIDIDVRIVPNVISLPGIVIGLLFSLLAAYVTSDPSSAIPTPLSALLGVLIGGGFLLATALIYEKLRGREGMGMGDVKLLAMIGAFLGGEAIFLTLFLASLTGAVVGLASGGGRYAKIPFGPFLCSGALIYLFFGQGIMVLTFD